MYRIVTLTEEYIESLVELEKLCFDEPWTKGMFMGDLSSEYTCYFAAIDNDNKVVGYAGMWAAIFADVGVMVLAVLNSLRAMKVKKEK